MEGEQPKSWEQEEKAARHKQLTKIKVEICGKEHYEVMNRSVLMTEEGSTIQIKLPNAEPGLYSTSSSLSNKKLLRC